MGLPVRWCRGTEPDRTAGSVPMVTSAKRSGSLLLVSLCAVAALATACSDDAPSAEEALADGFVDMTGEEVVTIDVLDNVFEPERVVVSEGTEVRWENRGRTPHNVIASEEGAFDDVPVAEMQPGDVAVRTFDDAGAYPYYCSLHGTPERGQIGEIRVVAS